jgi:hypothetical protein
MIISCVKNDNKKISNTYLSEKRKLKSPFESDASLVGNLHNAYMDLCALTRGCKGENYLSIYIWRVCGVGVFSFFWLCTDWTLNEALLPNNFYGVGG